MEQIQQQELKELGSKLDAPPASKDALLKLLKHGETCISEIEQSPSKTLLESMQPFSKAMVKPELLKHHDREVKLLVAACICEITRITAPVAPYDDDTLKDVFQLFVSTFNRLSDINCPAFGQILDILDTLARTRFCVVMLDIECDDLIVEMFNTFFTVARDEHPENVFTSMQTIMELLLEESDDVPENLLLTLLSVLGRDNEDVTMAARRLAMDVVKHCAGKLEPGIKQFLVSSMSGDSKSLKSDINYHATLQILSRAVPYLTGELLRPFVPSVEEDTKILEAGVLGVLSDAEDNEEQPSNVCKPAPSCQNDKPTSSLEFSGSISGMFDLLHSVESHVTRLVNTTTCLDKSMENLSGKIHSVESHITRLVNTTTSLDKSIENLSQRLDSPPPPPSDVTDFSVSSYDLEYRASKDDAWDTVCLVLDTSAETLTVSYLCSPEMNAVFSAGDFMTEALLEELVGRFRPVSWELQDDKCQGLSWELLEDDDLVSIRVLEPTSQIDPRLHSFGEMVNKKIASSKIKSAVPCLGKESNGSSLKGVRT